MGYGENSNWRWHAVYLQGLSGRYFYTCGTTCISSTRPSENQWPSLSDMENIASYWQFNYGAHTQISDKYIHFVLIYTPGNILHGLQIKHLLNQDGEPTTQHKMSTVTKLPVSDLHVLFCPCVVQKSTAHVDKKALKMRHWSHQGFRGVFVGIPQHQKGYLIYVPSTRKIVSSHEVVFDGTFYSQLVYTTYPYFRGTRDAKISLTYYVCYIIS